MARHYQYATHAQVLADHPDFEWLAVVDSNPERLRTAESDWSVGRTAADVRELGSVAEEIEVAVLATPPDTRLTIVENLPNLRAILVEKPLGVRLQDAREFLDACKRRQILVQVNLWRRADECFQTLAAGELEELVGRPQAAMGFYGNGLKNNGTHMIDFTRMLFGEVQAVQLLGIGTGFREGPLEGDVNLQFALQLESGLVVCWNALRFEFYREVGLIVWGEKGRLEVLNEGLTIRHYPVTANRAMTGEREVSSDRGSTLEATVGMALFRMYDNLADAVLRNVELWSPGQSALEASRTVEAISNAPKSGTCLQVN